MLLILGTDETLIHAHDASGSRVRPGRPRFLSSSGQRISGPTSSRLFEE